MPNLVGPIKMRKALGATLKQFKGLAEDGVLVPRTDLPTIKSPWRLEDGISLINELNAKVIEISVTDCDWELIQKAKSRTKMSVGSIIQLIREGTLRIALREGMQGYKNFCVNKNEVDQLVADNSGAIEKKPNYPDDVVSTASAFGRSIGMRENEAFRQVGMADAQPINPLCKKTSKISLLDAQDIQSLQVSEPTWAFPSLTVGVLSKKRMFAIGMFDCSTMDSFQIPAHSFAMHRLPDRGSDKGFDMKGSGALEQTVNECLGLCQQGLMAFVGGCEGSFTSDLKIL